MRITHIIGCQAILLLGTAVAGELPRFLSDQDADRGLRDHSPTYLWMAEGMDRRGGYEIAGNTNYSGGVAYTLNGRGYIGLNPSLKDAHRVSILIFEMTNLHQDDRHLEMAGRVRNGELNDPVEFSLMREVIEHDGFRLHWQVLKELRAHVDPMPADLFTWITPAASFDDYQPPFVFDYLKAQKASGHTDHYMRLFKVHRAEYTNAVAARGGANALPSTTPDAKAGHPEPEPKHDR